LKDQLQNLEQETIARTKSSISTTEQAAGKLIQRLPSDAQMINDTSTSFFTIIIEICREAYLAGKVTILPAASIKAKSKAIITEKLLPGVASVAISKQLEDAAKRAKIIYQCIQILLHTFEHYQHIKYK